MQLKASWRNLPAGVAILLAVSATTAWPDSEPNRNDFFRAFCTNNSIDDKSCDCLVKYSDAIGDDDAIGRFSVSLFVRDEAATKKAIRTLSGMPMYSHGNWYLDQETRTRITKALILFNRGVAKSCGLDLMRQPATNLK
jgi:hypothetical protein